MRLALDYDQTYTLDPPFWSRFVSTAKLEGNDIRVVTVRDDRFDRTQPLVELEKRIPVIYTRGVAKGFYCLHHAQWVPDIWIDDSPKSIIENSSATPDWLVGWRETRGEGVNFVKAS